MAWFTTWMAVVQFPVRNVFALFVTCPEVKIGSQGTMPAGRT
jgi:hypothetical protein